MPREMNLPGTREGLASLSLGSAGEAGLKQAAEGRLENLSQPAAR
jgi:hypothetical protein